MIEPSVHNAPCVTEREREREKERERKRESVYRTVFQEALGVFADKIQERPK